MGQQSVADIRAKFKAREKVVVIVADGGLLAEHERLSAELEQAVARGEQHASLAGNPSARDLAEQVRELEAAITAATVTFRVRGVGRNKFRRLLDEHPAPDGSGDVFDADTFPVALVAACSLNPPMTEAEVRDLADVLSDGQWGELFDAAFAACREVDEVPFSVLASAVAPS